jgi:nicotinate-nucleotide pyrophosphorylase (carboxylating)
MLTENAKLLINLAISEDIGDGDHTSLSTIPKDAIGKAKLLVKEYGVLAGIEVAKYIFNTIDNSAKIDSYLNDGNVVKYGDIAFSVTGNAQKILQSERLALNFMQRMSGIATLTSKYVEKAEGTKAKVLDTRKTSPGLRYFEKEAVRIGGGTNHRFGLYDLIMIKDNHVDFAGGITKALEQTTQYLKSKDLNIKIEVETRNFIEIEEVLKSGIANRIMLDNFTVDNTKSAVNLINGACEIESSGGINLNTISDYAKCGVDYISVGALTHQINSLDLSLKADF